MIIYGASAASLSEDLNTTVEEAEEFLNKYFSKFKGLHSWLRTTAEFGKAQKWVTNAYGRRLFVNESNSKGIDDPNAVARKSGNSVIQSTSSDMMKLALTYMDPVIEDTNSKLVAVVHDW